MKKISKVWYLVVALVVLGVAAYFLGKPDTKETISFDTATVGQTNIQNSITATGTIEPVTSVTVGTQVSGIVSKLYVDYNSVVKKGQVIAELDKTNLLSALNQAKAMLESAQAQVRSAESDVQKAQADYNGVRASASYQQSNFSRYQTLYKKGLISANDFESARLSYQQAQQNLAASAQTIATARQGVAQAREQVRQQQEQVKQAQTNLGYATITSPIDGVVLSKSVEEGQTVAASFSTPELFTIAKDLTNMQVVANVDEADIGEVKTGERVSFTVDAYPDDTFTGRVTQVRQEATTTNNVVTYEVVISAPNADLKLKPGLTANVTIYTQERAGVMGVSSKALRFTPTPETVGKQYKIQDVANAKAKVWTLEGNVLQAHRVSTGMNDGVNTDSLGCEGWTESHHWHHRHRTRRRQRIRRSGAESLRPRSEARQQKGESMMDESQKKVVIELCDVKRDFLVGEETVHALRGVSFKIYEGEFVTIMGKSGSGKSTLLNQLGCLDTPTSGDYFLDGVAVRTMSKSQRAVLRNRKIGFIFQNYNLLAKTTSVENVELPLMYNPSITPQERFDRSVAALKAVGLGERLYHKSNQMSGGQMQRVAIARALVNNPAVILADEATGNLDTRTSFEILVLFQKLHAEGRTIIFVTHNPDIAHYASRNIELRDGRIIRNEVNDHILSAAEGLAALPKNTDE